MPERLRFCVQRTISVRRVSIAMLVYLWLVTGAQLSRAQSANQVGLVVVHGDGSVVVRCVEFGEPQISGYDVLQRSGLDLNIEISGTGAGICRIDHEGCTFPQQSCFCQAEGETYAYWSYWHWEENGWTYSQLGASNRLVEPGSIEGWVWGPGTVSTAPPAIPFAEVCAPATALPTETPTATPTESATETPSPSPFTGSTPAPPTATPTLTPMPTATQATNPSATWTLIPTTTSTGAPTPAPPHIAQFDANRPLLEPGQSARLSWFVREAVQVVLQGEGIELAIGSVGSLEVQPEQTTSYRLVARNPAGEVSATVVITVHPPVAPATDPLPPPSVAVSIETAPVTAGVELAVLPPAETPTPTAAPAPTNTMAPTLIATDEATPPTDVGANSATPMPTAAVAAATIVWPTPTPDPARAQLQLLMIFGGVALVLMIPMGVLALATLVWVIRGKL